MPPISRRSMLGGALAGSGILAAPLAAPAIAQYLSVRIGLMLPFSGPDAALAESISSAVDMHIKELGGKIGGRRVELFRVDDGSDPAKAMSNVNWTLGQDKADVLVGTVNSEVVMALVEAAHDQGVPLMIPGAGLIAATREMCAPAIFRSSFSNWQPGFALGKTLAATGIKKAAWASWSDAAGKEAGDGFADGLRSGGAELTRALTVRYPETNFQPLLARLSSLGVDAAGALFTGAGAVQFVEDYAAAGLREKIPLYGVGFLTEGLLKRQGAAAEGLRTVLHYGDGIDNPKNAEFRAAYKSFCDRDADVYAVQGYDAAQMLAIGLDATRGDGADVAVFAAAIMAAKIDSPRGPFALSPAHNPVQNFWLREAKNGENRVIGVAAEALADPATGCTMA
jgi:branched-chain amino acid transport system substrate-binding protein